MKKHAAAEGSSELSAELNPMISGHLMKSSPDNMSVVEQVQAHVILKKVGDAVESRLKELRKPLMGLADAKGVKSEKSDTKTYEVDGSKVSLQSQKPKLPEKEALKKLLLQYKIDVMDVFDEVKVLEVNASKLNYLVDTGKLKKDDVQKICDDAAIQKLVIYPSKELKEAVASLSLEKGDDKALNE